MQGTIKEFDDGARSGSVLTDDRIEYAIEASSLDALIRILRPGQRVIFEAAETDGRKIARDLRLVTFAS
jgi:hypothetical protein